MQCAVLVVDPRIHVVGVRQVNQLSRRLEVGRCPSPQNKFLRGHGFGNLGRLQLYFPQGGALFLPEIALHKDPGKHGKALGREEAVKASGGKQKQLRLNPIDARGGSKEAYQMRQEKMQRCILGFIPASPQEG